MTKLPVSAPPRAASQPKERAPKGPLDMDGFLTAYRTQCTTLGIRRTVVVHSILYGSDNAVTIEAVRRLGADARGIGLLRDGAPEAALDALRDAGIMGIRLNYVHGGVLSWEGAKALAPALTARGMHLQMLVNADKHMADLAPQIRALPCPVVLDHIGWPIVGAGPAEPGFAAMRALVADGAAYVKLSGLYRVADAPWQATDPLVASLVAANPERCLWGSDFPYIMLADAVMPDAGALYDAFCRVITREADRQTIMVDAPVGLYGFED